MLESYVVSVLLASSSIAAATPDGGAAASPVTVTGCVQDSTIIPVMGRGPGGQVRYKILEISFVNRSPVTARHVRIAVGGGADSQLVDAFGKFSTGSPITRDFEPANDDIVSSPGNCSIELVEFTDGSSWRAP